MKKKLLCSLALGLILTQAVPQKADASVVVIAGAGVGAYYLIDDVCFFKDGLPCVSMVAGGIGIVSVAAYVSYLMAQAGADTIKTNGSGSTLAGSLVIVLGVEGSNLDQAFQSGLNILGKIDSPEIRNELLNELKKHEVVFETNKEMREWKLPKETTLSILAETNLSTQEKERIASKLE